MKIEISTDLLHLVCGLLIIDGHKFPADRLYQAARESQPKEINYKNYGKSE